MVFGRNMISPDEVDIDAPRDSDAWYLALMERQFPGSFLPFGKEQIVRTAAPSFRLVRGAAAAWTTSRRSSAGGPVRAPSLRKTLLKARLVPRWLTSATSGWPSPRA